MSLFKCGFPGVKYIFLFIILLKDIIQRIVSEFVTELNTNNKRPGALNYITGLSIISGGHFYFLSKLSKTNAIPQRTQLNQKIEHKILRFVVSLIPGITKALELITKLLMSYIESPLDFVYEQYQITIRNTIQMLTFIGGIPLIMFIIYRKPTFRHHLIGLLLIAINIIIISVSRTLLVYGDDDDNDEKPNTTPASKLYLIYFLSFLYGVFNDISLIIQKYEIETYFYPPFYVQFMTGVSYLVVYMIFMGIVQNRPGYSEFFFIDFGYSTIIIHFIINFIDFNLNIKILNDLTSMHVIFVLFWKYLLELIDTKEFSQDKRGVYPFLLVISTILVVAGFLLYTESVIVKACGLEYNTEKYIKLRGESENDENLLEIKEIKGIKGMTSSEDDSYVDDN